MYFFTSWLPFEHGLSVGNIINVWDEYGVPQPLIYAALITLVFSALINWIVLRKVKRLNLTDINK